LELDSSDAGREFNRYDLVVKRLESQVNTLLADAARDPSRIKPSLNREIERLDYQIDMLRLAAMAGR
jgi:hypothetical protein